MSAKVLILDIETAPKVAYVWRFFKENISAKQVLDHGHIMSFAAKWLGEKEVFYEEARKDDEKLLVEKMIYLLDEADIVVAHYGDNFDIPQIRGKALVYGLKPPSSFKSVDTKKVASKQFNFPSNSLEYLSDVLGCKVKKGGHKKYPGFELWLECLRNNDEAWKELKEYNIQDVVVLEDIYIKMLPWITNHPNTAIYENDQEVVFCPKCSSPNIQWRGFSHTNVSRYHRFQCNDCGGWGRSRYSLLKKNEKRIVSEV